MSLNTKNFIEHLRHYLPSQASLKDFIHHNTLHGFQDRDFHQACFEAAEVFGYSTYLSLAEYRELYGKGRIRDDILRERIAMALPERSTPLEFNRWFEMALHGSVDFSFRGRLGAFRQGWKDVLKINLDKAVHPKLIRVVSAYLDQGISGWKFPYTEATGLLENLRTLDLETNGLLFGKRRTHQLLHDARVQLEDLLEILVGDPLAYEAYVWDQQMEHPGWSGMVATLEFQESALLDRRKITLEAWIFLECLLEIDALDSKYPTGWSPLTSRVKPPFPDLFEALVPGDEWILMRCWQEAYEWSYYQEVLNKLNQGVQPSLPGGQDHGKAYPTPRRYQALFCIDDREHSLRRHLETVNPNGATYGTPGFFGMAFYFRPEHGRFLTKCCPFPVQPTHVILESERKQKSSRDYSIESQRQSLVRGMIGSMLWSLSSTARLVSNMFKPSPTPVMADSSAHMDPDSLLEIEFKGEFYEGFQRGFTVPEMAARVSHTLKSIGLTYDFAPLVYVLGHGASSVNNPYYAGYDCGACSGRPGSVNARVLAMMANRSDVRHLLTQEYGLTIPKATRFVGGLHDTTLDSVVFYDTSNLDDPELWEQHLGFTEDLHEALRRNQLERTVRFDNIERGWPEQRQLEAIRQRAYAFYEPRPEWNHTDNALVLIGSPRLYRGYHWDKRPFINNYDYRQDPEGNFLLSILSAAIPVCGGINLEYYFSRVDPHRLGAGTKLPHNVVGLFAVNNGVEGDLRPGLPAQMVEIHEPIRLLFLVEQSPQLLQKILTNHPTLAQWVDHAWVWLAALDPVDRSFYRVTSLSVSPINLMP